MKNQEEDIIHTLRLFTLQTQVIVVANYFLNSFVKDYFPSNLADIIFLSEVVFEDFRISYFVSWVDSFNIDTLRIFTLQIQVMEVLAMLCCAKIN